MRVIAYLAYKRERDIDQMAGSSFLLAVLYDNRRAAIVRLDQVQPEEEVRIASGEDLCLRAGEGSVGEESDDIRCF